MLAPVTLVLSFLMFIKSSTSGCLQSIVIIKAPLRPSWATSRVVLEYLSIKLTGPVEDPAAFVTETVFGLKVDISVPTPPRRFMS